MLAIRVHEFGGPDVLRVEEVDLPRPGPGELLVRVIAAGVGPWDVSLRQGAYTGPLPYIPGGEFAGLVEGETGAFSGFHDGAPVYGYPGLTGCYARYVTCPAEQLAPIPLGLSITDAAATPIDCLTAEQGLTDELNVGPGDRVLITGSTTARSRFTCRPGITGRTSLTRSARSPRGTPGARSSWSWTTTWRPNWKSEQR